MRTKPCRFIGSNNLNRSSTQGNYIQLLFCTLHCMTIKIEAKEETKNTYNIDDLTQNMINSVIHRRSNQEIKHCTHIHMHIENLNPT